jgi:GT2 family glycosyltransferase
MLLKNNFQFLLGKILDRITITTGNSSARRDDLINIGMFDENYCGWGIEDVDLGYRLMNSGVMVKRDLHLANYHLVHPVNIQNKKEEYRRNFNYFARKIKNDKVSIYMTRLINQFFASW